VSIYITILSIISFLNHIHDTYIFLLFSIHSIFYKTGVNMITLNSQDKQIVTQILKKKCVNTDINLYVLVLIL